MKTRLAPKSGVDMVWNQWRCMSRQLYDSLFLGRMRVIFAAQLLPSPGCVHEADPQSSSI